LNLGDLEVKTTSYLCSSRTPSVRNLKIVMRFVLSSSTQEKVVRELRKVLQLQAEQWSKVLRSNVLVSPTLRNDQFFLRRPKKWKQYLRLLMVHWYLPEESFALVHLELEELENKFGTENSIIAHMMLNSEPEMILYILESNVFKNERALFGYIQEPFRFQDYYFFLYRPRRAKRAVRRRGYKDHGSRRLPHQQHEAKYDHSFTEHQNQIEEERQTLSDLKELYRGFLE
jgi:hypothetical protein